jgi:hypothetical protein
MNLLSAIIRQFMRILSFEQLLLFTAPLYHQIQLQQRSTLCKKKKPSYSTRWYKKRGR